MKNFKVYHFDAHKYSCSFGQWYEHQYDVMKETEAPSFPDDYDYVADVIAPDIDEVFHLTNNIDRSWTRNPEVSATKTEFRSTSCGDVVVDENGKAFLCASVGWEEIKKEEV